MIQPPRRGPTIGPIMAPMPKMAMAWPCFSRGKASSRMDWLIGTRPPPPMPWRTRKNMRLFRLHAEPHMKELNVNNAMEAIW